LANGLRDILVEFEGGHNHDVGSGEGRVGNDLLGGPQAVAVRHPDVHEHDVGFLPRHQGEGLGSRARFAHHLEVALRLEQ
jgi:hypothetical protein